MAEGIRLNAAIRETAQRLAPICGESAFFEARQLITKAAGLSSMGELMLLGDGELSADALERLRSLTHSRMEGRPLQYVLGEWEFMGLPFRVDERALIPRQDTETLCEHALCLIKERKYKNCLDMCCGSGCIGIALAALSSIELSMSDISQNALSLAAENAAANGVSASMIQSDLFDEIYGAYDIIVCNPPYLDKRVMAALQRELEFEPKSALYGGEDGLDFYRRIAERYAEHINIGGALLVEVGAGQAQAVSQMLDGAYRVKDVNGIERVVVKA